MTTCPGCNLPVIETTTPLLPGHKVALCRRCSLVRVQAIEDSWLPMCQASWAKLRDKAVQLAEDRRKEAERQVQEIRADIEQQLSAINFGD
jgi:hypothetical protein